MKSFILGKTLSSLAVIFVLTIIIFLMVRLLPGDAVTVMMGGEGTPEQIEAVRAKYNLNEPLPNQYMAWLTNALRGDWGTSLASRAPVMPIVLERLPRTLLLGLVSTTLALTVAIHSIPPMIRLVRGSMLEVLGEDYITLALTKGNPPTRVYFVHALRNSLIPIATTISLLVTSLMAGVIVIEKVFQFPGIGLLLLNAIQARDYPMIQACILIFSAIVVAINMFTDIVYAAIDPKIRFE
jgi:ABC-type dipeptide/oligopeptide/nickel transport system permease component